MNYKPSANILEAVRNIVNEIVSIIVPVYNVEHYLERCLISIRNQTYQNIEIILVDDGSIDKSGAMCDKYALEDNRIVVIHKTNGGLSSARNAGLDMCKGSFVVFVDSDDYLNINYIEEAICTATYYSADVVFFNMCLSFSDGKTVPFFRCNDDSDVILDNRQMMDALLKNEIISHSACDKFFSANLFHDSNRFKEGVKYEDIESMHRFLANASKGVFINKNWYYYYMSEKSITRGNSNTHKYLDYYKASCGRVAFYKEFYFDLLNTCLISHIKICFDILPGLFFDKKIDRNLVQMIENEAFSTLLDIKDMSSFSFIDKVKITLFKINPRLLYYFATIWRKMHE